MKWTHVLVALVAVLALTLGPAVAQMGKPGTEPASEEPMACMTMMDRMRAEMRHMQEQMDGMHGGGMRAMGPMHERMGRMMAMMREMHTMMEEHREQMRAQCPVFQVPAPRPGG